MGEARSGARSAYAALIADFDRKPQCARNLNVTVCIFLSWTLLLRKEFKEGEKKKHEHFRSCADTDTRAIQISWVRPVRVAAAQNGLWGVVDCRHDSERISAAADACLASVF